MHHEAFRPRCLRRGVDAEPTLLERARSLSATAAGALAAWLAPESPKARSRSSSTDSEPAPSPSSMGSFSSNSDSVGLLGDALLRAQEERQALGVSEAGRVG